MPLYSQHKSLSLSHLSLSPSLSLLHAHTHTHTQTLLPQSYAINFDPVNNIDLTYVSSEHIR